MPCEPATVARVSKADSASRNTEPAQTARPTRPHDYQQRFPASVARPVASRVASQSETGSKGQSLHAIHAQVGNDSRPALRPIPTSRSRFRLMLSEKSSIAASASSRPLSLGIDASSGGDCGRYCKAAQSTRLLQEALQLHGTAWALHGRCTASREVQRGPLTGLIPT